MTPGSFPDPAEELPSPPNNLLVYAITWFGLAVTLLVMFSIFVRRTIKAPL